MDHSLDSDLEPQYSDADSDLVQKLNQISANMNQNCDLATSVDEKSDKQCVVVLDEADVICLTDLPTEILIYIVSFLEPRDIGTSLYRTCKLFYELFGHDSYWRTRLSQRFPKPFPIFDDEDLNWRKACIEREETHRVWSDPQEYHNHTMVREGFFAAVDVVHLMKGGRCLAVGSRDRHLNILDLAKYDSQEPKQTLTAFSDTKTHKGWVWSMASHGDTLVTGSWDTFIRLWDIGDGNVNMISHVKLKTAILGLHYEPNFIAAGGFDKRLHMFDPRDPDNLTRKSYHAQPILSIAADDKYVITGSEDKTIAIYDRTAGKKYKQIEIDSFVMAMSYGNGQLWTGDKQGNLHVLNAKDGLFDENNIQTFDVGHIQKMTGVLHTGGGIFTCSSDFQIKVLEPSMDPAAITTLTAHTGEVTNISYEKGVMASAGADIAVGVWIPKNMAF